MMDQPKENLSVDDIFAEHSKSDSIEDFSTTQWSVVMEASFAEDPNSVSALDKLCCRYWPPVRAHISRMVQDQHEAEDLAQSFFADFLKNEALKRVDRNKGRFREFLLLACKDFLAQNSRQRAGVQAVTLTEAASELDRGQITGLATPEKLFDQSWARVILETSLNRLKEEYSVDKKIDLFERLKSGLTGKADQGWYAILAEEMHMSEGSIRVALHRLRRRFGEILRKEVARTVIAPTEIDEEIRHLFSVIEAGGAS